MYLLIQNLNADKRNKLSPVSLWENKNMLNLHVAGDLKILVELYQKDLWVEVRQISFSMCMILCTSLSNVDVALKHSCRNPFTMSLPRDIFGTSRISFQLKIIWKWVMFNLFHHILISHYIMNQKVGCRSLYTAESYVTLATADSRSCLNAWK